MDIQHVTTDKQLAACAELAASLYEHETSEAMRTEFESLTSSHCLFLAVTSSEAAGFIHLSLRHDYVEGTGSSPVLYLEGIYVKEPYRKTGTASALLKAGEAWGREQSCKEMGSDTVLTNESGAAFHEKAGFTEVNRIICFAKRLDR
ncbi:aminoglycoside 6'-N-acetyltransferase [Alkalicoccus luteus]|uniref:GNAT family N-acetyltransferase n=1 Tax=Alkalicoccus luteus TaxID=1237094 RepID=A0A969PMF4_9BACI|nr:aminoglycoside 6'-N-acetyltransferase [Alkalicoccus luteus]NJP36881.1 GNAT family N-acetyltransferase [Alkalicoccus luteus]